MSIDLAKLANQSELHLGQSTLIHLAVDLSTDNYESPDKAFKGLYLAAGGDVVIVGIDGVETTFEDMPAGWNPCGGIGVIKTGTTAAGIVALF